MENNCNNCKHSHHLATPEWPDTWENALQEENRRNTEYWEMSVQDRVCSMYTMRFFWKDIRDDYERRVKNQTNNIECRWGPNFVERKKTDLCGQWEEST